MRTAQKVGRILHMIHKTTMPTTIPVKSKIYIGATCMKDWKVLSVQVIKYIIYIRRTRYKVAVMYIMYEDWGLHINQRAY